MAWLHNRAIYFSVLVYTVWLLFFDILCERVSRPSGLIKIIEMSMHATLSRATESLATRMTNAAGNTYILLMVFAAAVAWGISGFYLHFSEQWEMIISTASSVVTFIMVFLIQKSQNKHSLSIQLKLNELVAANHLASNRLVDVEGMSEDELKVIKKYYAKLSRFTEQEGNPRLPHSIDELHDDHSIKKDMDNELGGIGQE